MGTWGISKWMHWRNVSHAVHCNEPIATHSAHFVHPGRWGGCNVWYCSLKDSGSNATIHMSQTLQLRNLSCKYQSFPQPHIIDLRIEGLRPCWMVQSKPQVGGFKLAAGWRRAGRWWVGRRWRVGPRRGPQELMRQNGFALRIVSPYYSNK